MQLFITPASGFVRKVRITIVELGLEHRFTFVPTRWPHTWGTQTVPFRPEFAAATPVGRIPALVTDGGLQLTDSSVICEYLNAEFGGYRLCPAGGEQRWRILSVLSMANAVLEAQAARRAEMLRQASPAPSEYSQDFAGKMLARQQRCYQALEDKVAEFGAEPDLGQIAVAAACGIADFRFHDDWQSRCPRLAGWYDRFRERPSMRATEPQETPTEPDQAAAPASAS